MTVYQCPLGDCGFELGEPANTLPLDSDPTTQPEPITAVAVDPIPSQLTTTTISTEVQVAPVQAVTLPKTGAGLELAFVGLALLCVGLAARLSALKLDTHLNLNGSCK